MCSGSVVLVTLLKMLCPRCKQSEIVAAKIRATGGRIFVCQECEATWFSPEEISSKKFLDLGLYMEEVGLPPLWDELIVLADQT